MRMIWCVLGACCLLLGAAAAQAQSEAPATLTLAEARARAQRSSPQIRAARQDAAAAAGRTRQAGAFPNPVLSYDREQTSGGGETNWQNVVSLGQPLELGGQRGARRAVAAHRERAALAMAEAEERRVGEEVARSYAAAVAAGQRARLADNAARAFERAERVSSARLAAGDVSGYEHRRIRLEAARYVALRLAAAVARDSALAVLAALVGDPSGRLVAGDVALTDTLLSVSGLPPLDSLTGMALANDPELRAAVSQAAAAAAEADLARAERVPTLVLSGGFKNEGLTTGGTLSGFVAGASLPLPLWDRRGGSVAAAEADSAVRVATLEVRRRAATVEVRTAWVAAQALETQLGELQPRLGPESLKARQAADAAYVEGELTLLEWLDAVRAYQEAESLYITLWAEQIARRAALERATGAPLL